MTTIGAVCLLYELPIVGAVIILLEPHINSDGIGYCLNSLLTKIEGNVSTIQSFLVNKKD